MIIANMREKVKCANAIDYFITTNYNKYRIKYHVLRITQKKYASLIPNTYYVIPNTYILCQKSEKLLFLPPVPEYSLHSPLGIVHTRLMLRSLRGELFIKYN